MCVNEVVWPATSCPTQVCLRLTLDRNPRMLACLLVGEHVYVQHIGTCEASLFEVKYKCEVNALYVGWDINYALFVHDL